MITENLDIPIIKVMMTVISYGKNGDGNGNNDDGDGGHGVSDVSNLATNYFEFFVCIKHLLKLSITSHINSKSARTISLPQMTK